MKRFRSFGHSYFIEINFAKFEWSAGERRMCASARPLGDRVGLLDGWTRESATERIISAILDESSNRLLIEGLARKASHLLFSCV